MIFCNLKDDTEDMINYHIFMMYILFVLEPCNDNTSNMISIAYNVDYNITLFIMLMNHEVMVYFRCGLVRQ